MKSDPDIPAQYRGGLSIIVADFEGSPIIMPGECHAIAMSADGPVRLTSLPVIAAINGISEDAFDRIAEIIENFHEHTGVPIISLTRSTILRALVAEGN